MTFKRMMMMEICSIFAKMKNSRRAENTRYYFERSGQGEWDGLHACAAAFHCHRPHLPLPLHYFFQMKSKSFKKLGFGILSICPVKCRYP